MLALCEIKDPNSLETTNIRMRAEIVQPWLSELAHFIANHPECSYGLPYAGLEMQALLHDTGKTTLAYEEMMRTQSLVEEFKVSHDPIRLYEIEQSPLVCSSDWLLSLPGGDSEWDTTTQQGRMFLLGIHGWGPTEAEIIVDHVRAVPNHSRKYTGKVPAWISMMAGRIADRWTGKAQERDEFLERIIYKAHHGWPAPAK
jgi:hypothetical protein